MSKIRIAVVAVILAVIAALIGVGSMTQANATSGNEEPCVPAEAWTEVIEHPAVTHVVHHEAVTHVVEHPAVTHVVHHDAVTHTVHIIDVEASPEVWANFSPDHQQGPFEGPPSFPFDERGTWHLHDKIPGGHAGPDGVYNQSNDNNGRASWFYRHNGVLEVSHDEVVVDQQAYDETVVDEEAWTETVVDAEAYDETVVDEEAWTETIEHPAITCEGEQPDPLVQVSSSTSYECGDDFQTTETVTTTTEYVLVEGEWVLGEPVSETVTETADHAVVPCDTDEPPVDNPPVDNPPTNTPPVTHNNPPAPQQPAAVPTVIDAGL